MSKPWLAGIILAVLAVGGTCVVQRVRLAAARMADS
jgi:hypothetical protein